MAGVLVVDSASSFPCVVRPSGQRRTPKASRSFAGFWKTCQGGGGFEHLCNAAILTVVAGCCGRTKDPLFRNDLALWNAVERIGMVEGDWQATRLPAPQLFRMLRNGEGYFGVDEGGVQDEGAEGTSRSPSGGQEEGQGRDHAIRWSINGSRGRLVDYKTWGP